MDAGKPQKRMTPRRWQLVGGWASGLLFASTFNAIMNWPQTWWQFGIGMVVAGFGYASGKHAVREWQDAR